MSQSKRPRKKPPETLDWRELAKGPALRGLAEVLGASTSEIVSPTVGEPPCALPAPDTGGVSPTAESRADEKTCVAPTEGDTTAVGGPRSTSQSLGMGIMQPAPFSSESDLPQVSSSLNARTAEVLSPSEGVPTSEVVSQAGQNVCDVSTESEPQSPGGQPVPFPSRSNSSTEPSIGSPAEVGIPSVGVTHIRDEGQASLDHITPPISVGDTPTVIDTLSVGSSRLLGETITVGASPTGIAGWKTVDGIVYEAHRAQRVSAARDSLGLGEERVYQTLWQATESDGVHPEGEGTKIFSLGYDRIAHLVRLNEKSVRILLPKLIGKKVLEIVAAENSAAQTGRTYRVFSEEKVLERQRAAHLLFVVKNGRAVEFVHPVISPTVGVSPSAHRMPRVTSDQSLQKGL